MDRVMDLQTSLDLNLLIATGEMIYTFMLLFPEHIKPPVMGSFLFPSTYRCEVGNFMWPSGCSPSYLTVRTSVKPIKPHTFETN